VHTWPELVKIALLGTEKMPLPESILPEAVRRCMTAADPGDREAWFYKAAALTYVYEKAGAMPEKTPLPELPLAPGETRPVCPLPAQRFLARELSEKNKRADVLTFYFETLAARGWVLSPEQLVPVLNLCLQPPFKSLQEPVAAIAGERGRWMLQFNPAWQFLTPPDPNALWTEGSNSERRQYLQDLRQRDPGLAFELIRQCWVEETNSRERKELLKILQINPQAGESDFVEAILEELSNQKDKSKAIVGEIKQLATDLLLMDPESGLAHEIATQLQPYFTLQKSMLSTQRKHLLQIPDKPDAFLTPAVMCERLGMESGSPTSGVPDTAYWFSELLRRLHPAVWEQATRLPWPDIIKTFAAAEEKYKKNKWPLLEHLAQAFARSQYKPGICAFLDDYTPDASNYFMLNTLSDAELEAYIIKHTSKQLPDFLWDVLRRKGWIWSLPLSRHVLKTLSNAQQGGYHHRDFSKMLNLGIHFHLDILSEVQQMAVKEVKGWEQQVIHNQFLVPLNHILESRKTITQF
jgi:hypothetical protein